MSEVVISRRGSGSGKGVFMQEIISSNVVWKMPKSVVNNTVHVRIFGAGGCGSNEKSSEYYTGGSGWMNNDYIKLTPGEKVNIIIGTTNVKQWNANAGGPSSFGTHLTANGGDGYGGGGAAGRYGMGGMYGDAYQFGGAHGGNGGPWGGGGGYGSESQHSDARAGNGGIYGGGGGSSVYRPYFNIIGGKGGTYGGDGGWGYQGGYSCPNGYTTGIGFHTDRNKSTYGGTSAYLKTYGNRTYWSFDLIDCNSTGTNTIGWTNVFKDEIQNKYLVGKGSGGWHSIGGTMFPPNQNAIGVDASNYGYAFGIGGAGGFGGNGGNGNGGYGGGGGGYGSNGGDVNSKEYDGAGGGGYGGDGSPLGGGGGYGKVSIGTCAGGGYYCPGGGKNNTGGGGGIGIWDENQFVASYGSGGYNLSPPEGGVCIIQYYLK